MKQCPQCNATFEEGGRFCPECGAIAEGPLAGPVPQEGLVGRVEKNIYFKIARGFAWFILLLSTIVLAGSLFSLAPSAMVLWFSGNTNVTSDDVRQLMASQQSGGGHVEVTERIDPARLASVDRVIYEIIDLLPRERQQRDFLGRSVAVNIQVEELRRFVKDRLNRLADIDDQIAALKEAKNVIVVFPQPERFVAFDKFFEVKAAKQNAVQAKKTEAAANLRAGSLAILSSISIITLGSMVLVLLAVERNTRRA